MSLREHDDTLQVDLTPEQVTILVQLVESVQVPVREAPTLLALLAALRAVERDA